MSTKIEHIAEFIKDTEKILDRLTTLLTQDETSIYKIYREVHSLKGASGFAGLQNMEQVAHTFEGILSGIRDGKISLDNEQFSKIRKTNSPKNNIILFKTPPFVLQSTYKSRRQVQYALYAEPYRPE